MALTTYAGLSVALGAVTSGTWTRRIYTQGQVDDFLAYAEQEFNLMLGTDYRRITTATVNTDASGEGTLPTDFLTMRSVVRDVLGSRPLTITSWDALTKMNPYEVADDASAYAIRGTTIKTAPITDDDFILTYEAGLTPLSGSNASNWLSLAAPYAYLFMSMAAQRAYHEEWEASAGFEAKGRALVNAVVGQSTVAQFGNVELYLEQITP